MSEYEDLLRLHLSILSKDRLTQMSQAITAELRRRAGVDGGGTLFGGKKGAPEIECPYVDIVALYHAELPMLPGVRLMTDDRKGKVRKFWKWVLSSKKSDGTRRAETAEQALEWIKAYFGRARDNEFLMGKTQREGAHAKWRPDIEFMLSERGLRQVIERTEAAA